jgi:hypothetical protein
MTLTTINALNAHLRMAQVPTSTTAADRATIRAAMYAGQGRAILPDGTDVVIWDTSESHTTANADEWITVHAFECAKNRDVFYVFRSGRPAIPTYEADGYVKSIRENGYVCLPEDVTLEVIRVK